MNRNLILAAGLVWLAACNGANPVAPTSPKVVETTFDVQAAETAAFEEQPVDAPIDEALDKSKPPCDKGSPAMLAIVEHAPPEVFARLCAEKKP
jgi:hypothetical protein